MDTNMKATLCKQTLDNAVKAYPALRGAILYSDRGTQYTSELYRKAIISYWNNRRICSANGGLPPMVKRQRYYNSLQDAA